MSLKDADKHNFEVMQQAMASGDLGILECTDKESGEYRAVLVVRSTLDDGATDLVPVAVMAWANPYSLWNPPSMKDGPKETLS